jgi:hypothetical protein
MIEEKKVCPFMSYRHPGAKVWCFKECKAWNKVETWGDNGGYCKLIGV